MMEFERMLAPLERNAILLEYADAAYIGPRADAGAAAGGGCPVGASKIGGAPDLPPGFEWLYYEGKPYYGEQSYRPLSFLAQINCAEAHAHDKDNALPGEGMLYFFLEYEAMFGSGKAYGNGFARVLYHPGGAGVLRRTEPPADLPDENRLPEVRLAMSAKPDFPYPDEFREWHREIDMWHLEDGDFEAYIKAARIQEPLPGNTHKLLGYANTIQNGMLLECELGSNGLTYEAFSEALPPERQRQLEDDCTQWRLLLQLDSICHMGYEQLWGDVGMLYFYIKKSDLANRDFGHCWYTMQCS
jgi:uncharacterized protein YwqG